MLRAGVRAQLSVVVGERRRVRDTRRSRGARACDTAQWTLSRAVVDAVERIGPAVVSVTAELRPRARKCEPGRARGQRRHPGGRGGGSGVIFARDGYILTNHHVVPHAERISVALRTGASPRACGRPDPPHRSCGSARVGVRVAVAELGDSAGLRVGNSSSRLGIRWAFKLR